MGIISDFKQAKGTPRQVMALLRPFAGRIVVLSVTAIVVSVISAIQPLLRQHLMDDGVLGGDLRTVIIFLAFITLTFLITQCMEIVQFVSYTYINQMLPFRLFHAALRHLVRLPMSFFKDTNSSQIIGNLGYDIGNIAKISDQMIVLAVVQALNMVGGTVGLTIINWKLTLLVLAIIPIKILINHFFSKKREKVFKESMELNEQFYGWLGDTVQGVGLIKLWGSFRNKMAEFTKLRRKIIHNEYSLYGVERANDVSSSTIDVALTDVLYILGASLIFKDELTVGGLFAFLSYSSVVIGSITFLTRIRYHFSGIIPSLNRYLDFMETPIETTGFLPPPPEPFRIAFEDVELRYRPETVAVEGVSFQISQGQKVAVVGANGSGKSSLVQMLLRFYAPTSGRITLNGEDIQSIRMDDYRDLFSVIDQQFFLFNASVRDNIDPLHRHSDEAIYHVLDLLGASDLVRTLPGGLQTVVGVNGSKLSGGERQKIASARALIKPHGIIVFDEASSSLDADAEQVLNRIISDYPSDKLALVITHKPAVLKEVDLILVMEHGRLVASGDYETLSRDHPQFASFLNTEPGQLLESR